MDVLTKAQRRRAMQAIKASGTGIEMAMRKALSKEGLRYRLNAKNILGKPDFAFVREKIAVFCDSEFWHGKGWKRKKLRIKTNKKFWQNKIEGNIRRDRIVTRGLKKEGWKVLRFWGKNIDSDAGACADKVKTALCERKRLIKQKKPQKKAEVCRRSHKKSRPNTKQRVQSR